jgi:hypothetical protein
MWQVFRQDIRSLSQKIDDRLEPLVNWVFAFTQAGAQRRRITLIAGAIFTWLGLAFWLHPIRQGGDPIFDQVLHNLLAADVVRHMLVLGLAIFLAERLSAIFLDDVFELQDASVAQRFLQAAAFSGRYDSLTIRGGGVTEKDVNSAVYRIGGPGKADVHLENAALFEKTNGEPHIVGPTYRHYEILDGFERLRSVIDLRDQYIDLTVEGRTQDGIPVIAKDVRLVSSIYRGPQNVAHLDHFQQPYPYKDEAILNLVYKNDQSPLIEAITSTICNELRSFISSHPLSEFLTNAEPSNQFIPRDQITDLFYDYAKEFSQRSETCGVELKWIGVGTWVLPDKVIPSRQLEAWKLSSKARFNQSEYALTRIRTESRLAELLRLVDEVPNLFYTLMGQALEPSQITRRLLLDYREKLRNAGDLYENNGKPAPVELEIVINHLTYLAGIRLGGEN